MSEITVDLTKYPERFEKDTKLVLDKKNNFILWKNGTWKSTIAKTIKENYSWAFLYDWYRWIIKEDEDLDAIALWVENVELQEQIKSLDEKIKSINYEIDENWKWNLWENKKKSKEKLDKDNAKLQQFLSDSASIIKNITDPQIAKTQYNKNDFEEEIKKGKIIDENKKLELKNIIKENNKGEISEVAFPSLNSTDFVNRTNNILKTEIKIKKNIPEIEWNQLKQNFAREWMRVHEHKSWEICAFCWNVISDERWELLTQFFNEDVYNIENDIQKLLKDIQEEKEKINSIDNVPTDIFYEQFKEKIKSINKSIELNKSNYILFLTNLENKIKEKQKNIFNKVEITEIIENFDFSSIENEINGIITKHNELSENLEEEKDKAKATLRYHEIKNIIENSDYEILKSKVQSSNEEFLEIDKKVENKKQELLKLQWEKLDLLEKTKDESVISKSITECLKYSWIESFTLEHVSDDQNPSGKWYYRIRWHDWKYRSVNKLSEWEKNIIAFLYFYYSLQSPENQSKNDKIIIFDDPMTSNDDTLQYLMISKIKDIYNHLGSNEKFLLLTHNIHFYLNVRPYYNPTEDDRINKSNKKLQKANEKIENDEDKQSLQLLYHKKNNYFKLESNWILSHIKKIETYEDDYKSNYHSLREDLEFLYKENKPVSMLNNCRRILETFIHFNNYDVQNFYKEDEEAKKLFDVNSHGIEDLEQDINWKTCKQIMILFRNVFDDNKALEHFNSYFTIDIDQQEENDE